MKNPRKIHLVTSVRKGREYVHWARTSKRAALVKAKQANSSKNWANQITGRRFFVQSIEINTD